MREHNAIYGRDVRNRMGLCTMGSSICKKNTPWFLLWYGKCHMAGSTYKDTPGSISLPNILQRRAPLSLQAIWSGSILQSQHVLAGEEIGKIPISIPNLSGHDIHSDLLNSIIHSLIFLQTCRTPFQSPALKNKTYSCTKCNRRTFKPVALLYKH